MRSHGVGQQATNAARQSLFINRQRESFYNFQISVKRTDIAIMKNSCLYLENIWKVKTASGGRRVNWAVMGAIPPGGGLLFCGDTIFDVLSARFRRGM